MPGRLRTEGGAECRLPTQGPEAIVLGVPAREGLRGRPCLDAPDRHGRVHRGQPYRRAQRRQRAHGEARLHGDRPRAPVCGGRRGLPRTQVRRRRQGRLELDALERRPRRRPAGRTLEDRRRPRRQFLQGRDPLRGHEVQTRSQALLPRRHLCGRLHDQSRPARRLGLLGGGGRRSRASGTPRRTTASA